MLEINEDKKIISQKVEEYTRVILDEYQDYIPDSLKQYLYECDYSNLVKIENTNTISLFVSNNLIYLPTNAYKIIDAMKKIPGFGSKKDHVTHQIDNMIINNNTFLDYIKHVFLKGLSAREYFLEILLHETMHLCGSCGSYGLQEGFTELKTRELAFKYNLKTSCCGYPKETKIVLELQEILGKSICDKITFMKDQVDIYNLIKDYVGLDEANLYVDIFNSVEKQFRSYIKQHFKGIIVPLRKTLEYSKLDYSEVRKIFDKYYQVKNKGNSNKRNR